MYIRAPFTVIVFVVMTSLLSCNRDKSEIGHIEVLIRNSLVDTDSILFSLEINEEVVLSELVSFSAASGRYNYFDITFLKNGEKPASICINVDTFDLTSCTECILDGLERIVIAGWSTGNPDRVNELKDSFANGIERSHMFIPHISINCVEEVDEKAILD